MPVCRTLVLMLLISFLALTGCGGGGEESVATPTAATSVSITVSPSTTITTDETGRTAIISVSLGSQPTADVTIPVTSSDPTEGTTDVDSLVFTSTDWSTVQYLTVTGVSDTTNDGNQSYTIHLGPAESADSAYNALEKTISATNLDAKKGSVIVSPISGSTSESGGTATFSVHLGFAPAANVRIPVKSSDTAEGTVKPSELLFTSLDWQTPKDVIVTGVDDSDPGDGSYFIELGPTESTDSAYANLALDKVSVTNLNVKTGLVMVGNISGTITDENGNWVTDESGAQVTFEVNLSSKPAHNVTIQLISSDPTEATVSPTLTFTPDTWSQSQPQIVTVTGVADPEADGYQTYTIFLNLTQSDDDNYNGLDPVNVALLRNRDMNTGVIIVTAISGHTTESGGQAYFEVNLGSQPTKDVTIGVWSDNIDAGTVSTDHLTFTNSDWATAQRITVTGVSDTLAGDTTYHIVLNAAVSEDPVYDGRNPNDVPVLNEDRKNGAVTVAPLHIYTDEAGQSATFTVSLNHQPSEDVTLEITNFFTSEGTVSPMTLTFTNLDWAAKTVTVTGVDDDKADGDQTYLINLGLTSSDDNNFSGLNPDDVTVTNADLVDPCGVTPRISAGTYHNLALASDGTVWGWGTCSDGQLAAVDATCPASPLLSSFPLPQLLDITRASAVSAGDSFSVIVKADGTVWTSGKNDVKQLGHASGSSLLPVDGLTDIETVAAGSGHTLALKKALAPQNPGTVWAWGFGVNGQLGNGLPTVNSQTPVQAGNLTGIKAIAAGNVHSLALDNSGKVYSWGSDLQDQLGLEPGDMSTATPTAVSLLTNVSAIAAGQYYSFAVGQYSGVSDTWGWGSNNDYQLGTSSGSPKYLPTALNTFSPTLLPSQLDGGYLHSLALAPVSGINTVYAWGDNENTEPATTENGDNRGALGTGNTTDYHVPTVSFIDATVPAATDVNAGFNYSLVLLGDGRIKSSGMNNMAQLGTNNTASSIFTSTPVFIEDPGDITTNSTIPFYAYRPILSGQPATASTTTKDSATITVCTSTVSAYCKGITHYMYSTDGGVTWIGESSPIPIGDSNKINLTNLSGTVNLWVKGMIGGTVIQTNASAVKVYWQVIPLP